MIALYDVTMSSSVPISASPAGGTAQHQKLKQLSCWRSNGAFDVLVHPELSGYMANLRRLSFTQRLDKRLLSAAALSLEHIHFVIIRPSETLQPLPPLAALRSIDVWELALSHVDDTTFIDSLSTLLISSPPTLEEIIVTSWHLGASAWPYSERHSLEVLKRAFIDFPGSPRLRWRLHFNNSVQHSPRLDDFKEFLALEMPELHEQGRLIVQHLQHSSFDEEKRAWNLD
ncbi:hypothetical protein C8R44DRAFT_145696 [Mycena epipterygia]|nr:hypothetical protein C8R44DRAFT_145696 [Mycena epipterygia]